MGKATKIILTIVSLLIFFGLAFWLGKSTQKPDSQSQRKIDSLVNANKVLEFQNDSLLFANKEIDTQNEQYRLSIEQKNKEYERLKKQKNEEITHVINLPLDSAIMFFSRELSKEDCY